MTAEDMRRRKKELGLTNRELAKKAGVPFSTVAKVLSGTTPKPRKDTLRALEAVLQETPCQEADPQGFESDENGMLYSPPPAQDGTLQDKSPSYVYGSNAENRPDPAAGSGINCHSAAHGLRSADSSGLHGYRVFTKDGSFEAESSPGGSAFFHEPLHTLEDYLSLPDERRVEMIDGRFYDMAAPNGVHQRITLQIWKALDDCIEKHGIPCNAQAAPFDVQLDDHTVVEPDVMVFCEDPSQAFAVRATTPPDLVIEVLSRSTAFKDRHLKLFKYRSAGIKELWLVSPEKHTVEVYLFYRGKEEPETYTFADRVPVHISDGRCEVDFARILERLPERMDQETGMGG